MIHNHIIFKGIDSDDIKGLIIQELPSIVRAEKRVKYTEIDGRDGDIAEILGYKSYSKDLKIGLTSEADIDEVMNYFDGTGSITFSNEPDKVYTVISDKKISYDRLVRYRTATVSFHVQPFKYALYEESFTKSITNETSIKVSNIGYIESKPIIKLTGTGDVSISINGNLTFTINIDDDWVIIDSIEQEAYKDNILKNRKMNGEFPILKSGINVISWTGTLTHIKVEPKSRWV